MGSESTKKNKNYYYIWIDAKIQNSENSKYAKELSNIYAHTSFFTDINEAMKYLQEIKFKLTYIIVSGSLFPEFICELKNLENRISTVPKIIIFTSESTKKQISSMKEINDSFYDIGGLVVSFKETQSFLDKNDFVKELDFIQPLEREKIQTGGDFSFQIVENKNELIGPIYLTDLIIKPHN